MISMIRHPLDYLETIWQKPESTRKKILVVSVILISGAVIAAWLMTLSVPSITQPYVATTPREQAAISNIWESMSQLLKNDINP